MTINKHTSQTFAKVSAPIGISIFLGALFLWGLFGSTLEAAPTNAIYYVNKSVVGGSADGSSWDNAYPHLQDALGAATDGDQIWVAAGVYFPDEGVGQIADSVTATFQLTDGVKLYGGFAGGERTFQERQWEANITVLSGDIDQNDGITADGLVTDTNTITGSNSYHVVTTSYVTNTTEIDGFAITAGSAASNSPSIYQGGGLYNLYGHPQLKNLTFIGNQAWLEGGGMYTYGQSLEKISVDLTNVAFINNRVRADLLTNLQTRAPFDPEHEAGGLYSRNTNLTMNGISFIKNSTELGDQPNDADTAAFYFGNGRLSMDKGVILGNHTEGNNGAFYVSVSGEDESVEITNSIFLGNLSDNDASALRIYSSQTPITLTHNTFAGNWSESDIYPGHAVELRSLYTTTAFLLHNNIIWGNFAGTNNISTTANVLLESNAWPTYLSNNIGGSGGSGASWLASLGEDGGGNLDIDPLFVSSITTTQIPTDSGYAMLLAGSPVIDVANSDKCVSTDLMGTTRPQGSGCDIGAYEYKAIGDWTVNITDDLPDANPGDGVCDTNPYYVGSQCSLRAAIDESNALPREFKITLPAGTFPISIAGFQEDNNQTGDFDILDDLSIVGAGENQSYVQGGADQNNGLDRVFHVLTGTATVNIQDVTVRYGHISQGIIGTGDDDGAGLLNATTATVSISNTTFTQNVVDALGEDGGAIANINGGTVSIADSTIVDNHAKGGLGSSGGGLFNAYGSKIIVHNSVISGNVASSKGGGVYSNRDGATVLISDSTLSGNRAVVLGGALQNGATMIVTNTTVSGNSSNEHGGGISNDSADSNFTGSHLTIVGNTADADNNQVGSGGGIWLEMGAVVTLSNSILAGSHSGGDCANAASTFNDGGYNLVQDNSCISAGTSLSGDPQLGDLADNGGFGETHLPDEASPALNKIPAGVNGCGTTFTTDQRGAVRPLESSCDIGAVESDGILPATLHIEKTVSLTETTNVAPGTLVTYTIVFSNSGDLVANGATITDMIPVELISTTISLNLDSGVSLVYQNGTNAVWKLDKLGGDQQGTIKIAGTVDPTAYGKTITNSVTLEYESDTIVDSAVFSTADDNISPSFPANPLNLPADGSKTSPNPTFDWMDGFDGQSGVVSYTLTVTPSDTSRTVVATPLTFVSTETNYTPADPLPVGDYIWTVQAHDRAGNVTAADEMFSFTVQHTIYLPIVTSGE